MEETKKLRFEEIEFRIFEEKVPTIVQKVFNNFWKKILRIYLESKQIKP